MGVPIQWRAPHSKPLKRASAMGIARPMVPLSFAGHELMMLREAAIFWQARRALLLADLHFEKASWYAGQGLMLASYDSLATLMAIAALTDRVGAREIWFQGDSFHYKAGRMAEQTNE